MQAARAMNVVANRLHLLPVTPSVTFRRVLLRNRAVLMPAMLDWVVFVGA